MHKISHITDNTYTTIGGLEVEVTVRMWVQVASESSFSYQIVFYQFK